MLFNDNLSLQVFFKCMVKNSYSYKHLRYIKWSLSNRKCFKLQGQIGKVGPVVVLPLLYGILSHILHVKVKEYLFFLLKTENSFHPKLYSNEGAMWLFHKMRLLKYKYSIKAFQNFLLMMWKPNCCPDPNMLSQCKPTETWILKRMYLTCFHLYLKWKCWYFFRRRGVFPYLLTFLLHNLTILLFYSQEKNNW